MDIKHFNAFEHLGPLYKMLIAREHPLPEISELPAIGCMVFSDDGNHVAAAFLRRIEGGYGMVDGLVSNPKCSPEERHEALDLAIEFCIKEAAKRGITNLLAFALNETTTIRASRHGFVKQPHSMVTLEIKAKL